MQPQATRLGKMPGVQRAQAEQEGREASTSTAHQDIVETLRAWVMAHPSPDTPAISVASSGSYSPRRILSAVEQKEDAGLLFEDVIVHGAQLYPDGIAGVLRSFREEGSAARATAGEAQVQIR